MDDHAPHPSPLVREGISYSLPLPAEVAQAGSPEADAWVGMVDPHTAVRVRAHGTQPHPEEDAVEGANPFVIPPHLADLAHPERGEADDLTWDGIIAIPRHASEAVLLAVDYAATLDADDAGWLLLASAGYDEAAQLIDSETDEPGQHATPQVILAVIKNADRCAAMGGRPDIRIHPVLRHLTKQPDHRNPDGTWKD